MSVEPIVGVSVIEELNVKPVGLLSRFFKSRLYTANDIMTVYQAGIDAKNKVLEQRVKNLADEVTKLRTAADESNLDLAIVVEEYRKLMDNTKSKITLLQKEVVKLGGVIPLEVVDEDTEEDIVEDNTEDNEVVKSDTNVGIAIPKLTCEDVVAIKTLSETMTNTDIAVKYNVSASTISRIISGKTYKNCN